MGYGVLELLPWDLRRLTIGELGDMAQAKRQANAPSPAMMNLPAGQAADELWHRLERQWEKKRN